MKAKKLISSLWTVGLMGCHICPFTGGKSRMSQTQMCKFLTETHILKTPENTVSVFLCRKM